MFVSVKIPIMHATFGMANVIRSSVKIFKIRTTARFQRGAIGARRTQLAGRCAFITLGKMHASNFLMSVTGISSRRFVSKARGKPQI